MSAARKAVEAWQLAGDWIRKAQISSIKVILAQQMAQLRKVAKQ